MYAIFAAIIWTTLVGTRVGQPTAESKLAGTQISCADVVQLIARVTFDLRLMQRPVPTMDVLGKKAQAHECQMYKEGVALKWAATRLDASQFSLLCEKIPQAALTCFGPSGQAPMSEAQCGSQVMSAYDMVASADSMRRCRNLPVSNGIEALACKRRHKQLGDLFKRVDQALTKIVKTAPPELTQNVCNQLVQ